MIKRNQELTESEDKIFSFTVTDCTVEKIKYLRTLCTQIANTAYSTNSVCHY